MRGNAGLQRLRPAPYATQSHTAAHAPRYCQYSREASHPYSGLQKPQAFASERSLAQTARQVVAEHPPRFFLPIRLLWTCGPDATKIAFQFQTGKMQCSCCLPRNKQWVKTKQGRHLYTGLPFSTDCGKFARRASPVITRVSRVVAAHALRSSAHAYAALTQCFKRESHLERAVTPESKKCHNLRCGITC